MFPWLSFPTCSAASPCTRLSRAPSTTSGSDFHHVIGLLVDGPFGQPTRPLTGQDRGGSPRFRNPSFSVRAVLSDPAGVSNSLALHGSLLLPSRFTTLSASGLSGNEAQSLHLRYGLDIARSTLNPCRYLHESKTRFLVGRLIPLSRSRDRAEARAPRRRDQVTFPRAPLQSRKVGFPDSGFDLGFPREVFPRLMELKRSLTCTPTHFGLPRGSS